MGCCASKAGDNTPSDAPPPHRIGTVRKSQDGSSEVAGHKELVHNMDLDSAAEKISQAVTGGGERLGGGLTGLSKQKSVGQTRTQKDREMVVPFSGVQKIGEEQNNKKENYLSFGSAKYVDPADERAVSYLSKYNLTGRGSNDKRENALFVLSPAFFNSEQCDPPLVEWMQQDIPSGHAQCVIIRISPVKLESTWNTYSCDLAHGTQDALRARLVFSSASSPSPTSLQGLVNLIEINCDGPKMHCFLPLFAGLEHLQVLLCEGRDHTIIKTWIDQSTSGDTSNEKEKLSRAQEAVDLTKDSYSSNESYFLFIGEKSSKNAVHHEDSFSDDESDDACDRKTDYWTQLFCCTRQEYMQTARWVREIGKKKAPIIYKGIYSENGVVDPVLFRSAKNTIEDSDENLTGFSDNDSH